MNTLEQLNAGCEQAIKEGYSIFLSAFINHKGVVKFSVSLSKYSTSGTTMKVEGSGDSPSQAFENCFANFPKNPLQTGTGWVNHQLTPPSPVEDGEFNEVESTKEPHS